MQRGEPRAMLGMAQDMGPELEEGGEPAVLAAPPRALDRRIQRGARGRRVRGEPIQLGDTLVIRRS